jgi:tRNA pseudouridine38-40 synthase
MRIALGIEYDGHDFYGWQFQENLITVQSCLEAALTKIAAEKISLRCAGRTDAGVHAIGQVVHFDTQAVRDARAWTFGTRTVLPPTIGVRWSMPVDDKFHAQYSAQSRTYRYIIYNNKIRSAILTARATSYPYLLDIERMQKAADYLLGKHDFSSFRAAQCQSKTPVRTIHFINISRQNDFVVIDIKANAFLQHMVRNIAGILMRAGCGKIAPEYMGEILEARDRRKAFETAPPNGLYLVSVGYPDPYTFPVTPSSSLFY